ncbi:hypothetical protein GPECTOR_401g233 [Gonium pectorale]|uniref:Uncharacterized protein n=1 Tax=Gonium pectorale TaxID=33097 RepID=A0A150FVC5_GONPE|nr:hypothetical protein GPECTOR_401g233 [Gonium pectorale]|eukprot:KXZ41546.1 hypothetical protein GPECTOR_401g233 [Gonium pectorale]
MLPTHGSSHGSPRKQPHPPPQPHPFGAADDASNSGSSDSNNEGSMAAGCSSQQQQQPTTLAERLEVVTRRFLHDVCFGTSCDTGQPLEHEDMKRAASMYLAPGVVIHTDGALCCASGAPARLEGEEALFAHLERERASHRPVGLDTLLVAVADDQDTAFALSVFRVESCGPWMGREPTGRESEGVRIDELRFDPEAKVLEAWCSRQMFQEEREALLRDPATHHAAAFDRSALRQCVEEHENGSHGPLAPHKMMRVAAMWAESWNVATASGSLNPDLLDLIAEPGFTLHDLYGLTGDDPQHPDHPFTAIRSRDDAKAVLQQLTDTYDVDEQLVRVAARKGTNAVFMHWRAGMVRRGPQSVAERQAAAADPYALGPGPTHRTSAPGGSAPSPASASASGDAPSPGSRFTAEGTDLLLFSPTGKLTAIYQFRRPLGSDRRGVLTAAAEAAAAGGITALAPAPGDTGVEGSQKRAGGPDLAPGGVPLDVAMA